MMTNRVESEAEYTARCVGEAHAQIRRVESASLADRRAAQADFAAALRKPELIAERLGWLFDGNYGYGEMKLAEHVLSLGARSNKEAQLCQLIAALEWQCPRTMAAKAWLGLSNEEKANLSAAVLGAMLDAVKGE